MTGAKLVWMLVCLMAVTLEPKDAKVTPLLSKDLTNFPGKEGLMITVEYPPGGSDPIHRHNAHAFVYVLEGSIVMQVRGGKEVTLTPGQTFYEGPSDIRLQLGGAYRQLFVIDFWRGGGRRASGAEEKYGHNTPSGSHRQFSSACSIARSQAK